MIVEGWQQVLAAGFAGGIFAEAICLGAALRAGVVPGKVELLASLFKGGLGGLIVLYGTEARPLLEAVTLGAAYPLMFSAGLRLTSSPGRRRGGAELDIGPTASSRRILDWLSCRF